MAARPRAVAYRVYDDFEPRSEWVVEEPADTFLVRLPDFKKEQLRVQLTPARVLKISGERPLRDNKWKRFLRDIKVPTNCDTKEISARFEQGILYIRLPKLIAPAPQPAKSKPSPEPTSQPSETMSEAKPSSTQAPANGRPSSPVTKEADFEDSKGGAKFDKDEEPTKGKPDDGERKKNDEASKDEEMKERDAVSEKGRDVVESSDIFKQLKRPENLKKVVATVLLVLALALHIAYVKRTCRRMEGQEYYDGED